MAGDMFGKIGSLNGESEDKDYKQWIDVLGWSWGATQSASAHIGGGGGSGKVNMQDMTITKYVDTATSAILVKCATGEHFPECKLIVRKAGGTSPVEYLKVTMTNAIISSYSTGGSGGSDKVTETVSMNFEKVKVEYTAQTAQGGKGATSTFEFDVLKNA